MIGSRGFRIVEPPRASSGPLRNRRPFTAENPSPLASENRQPRTAPPSHSRGPPELPTVARAFEES